MENMSLEEKVSKGYLKVIKSGHIIEIYQYEKTLYAIDSVSKSKDKENDLEALENPLEKTELQKVYEHIQNRNRTARRARNMIRRLANANFDENSKFITLTFKDNIQDLDYAHKEFKKFIQRLNRFMGKSIDYIAVVEFQKRGAIHYHMIVNMDYIEHELLYALWQNRRIGKARKSDSPFYCIGEQKALSNGFVKINKITHVDNVGAYLVKYMTKNNMDDRLEGRKSYFTSRGLERPQEFNGEIALAILESVGHKEEVFSNHYETEYLGTCLYKEYNLKRN